MTPEPPYAMATVVRVDPPVSTRVGDKAVVTGDGRLEGWVGGACAEPIVVREALAALAEGRPRLVRITPAELAASPAAPSPEPGVVAAVSTSTRAVNTSIWRACATMMAISSSFDSRDSASRFIPALNHSAIPPSTEYC